MSAATLDPSGCVLVPLERLRVLEALEAEMHTKKTAEDHDADRFKMLRERDKANPSAVTKRTMKQLIQVIPIFCAIYWFSKIA